MSSVSTRSAFIKKGSEQSRNIYYNNDTERLASEMFKDKSSARIKCLLSTCKVKSQFLCVLTVIMEKFRSREAFGCWRNTRNFSIICGNAEII